MHGLLSSREGPRRAVHGARRARRGNPSTAGGRGHHHARPASEVGRRGPV